MKNRLKFTLSLLILLTAPVSFAGEAAIYMAGLEQSHWEVEASIFECRLRQQIPRFGQAVFYHQAGTQARFYLDATDTALEAGQARLTSVPPQWRHGLSSRELGVVDVVDSRQPVNLDAQGSRRMLAELEKGMVPTLIRQAWYSEDLVQVGISPVNFAAAYREYRECALSLLPVNFSQIERSTVFWKPNQRELSEENKRQLNDIITYTLADPSVYSFEINGFTDASGLARENLELSRIRAYAVHDYLVSHGIDESMLATRYFGSTEQFRIIRNEQTAADRDRNRRVTLLLRRR